MDHNAMEQAIKEVRAGDIDQFGIIIDLMQKPLFVYCYHMLGHRQEAEDAVQEVFLKAFEQLDSYRHTVSFSAWMYKIAYHHCLNLLNRAKLNREIQYYKDDKKQLFEVRTNDPRITKEDLLAIAEKLK